MKVKIFSGYVDTMESAANVFMARPDINVIRIELSDGKIFMFYEEITQ